MTITPTIDIYTAAIHNESAILFESLKNKQYELFDWRVIGYLSGYGWIDTLKSVYTRWPKDAIEFPWDYHCILWACQNGCKECLLFCLDNGCTWDNDRKSKTYEPLSNLVFDTHFDLECFDILLQRGYTFSVMNMHFDNIFQWLDALADEIVEAGYLDTERWRICFFLQEKLIRQFVYPEFAEIIQNKKEEIQLQRQYSYIAYEDCITKDLIQYIIQPYF